MEGTQLFRELNAKRLVVCFGLLFGEDGGLVSSRIFSFLDIPRSYHCCVSQRLRYPLYAHAQHSLARHIHTSSNIATTKLTFVQTLPSQSCAVKSGFAEYRNINGGRGSMD